MLFLVADDWFFVSHRLAFASELASQGWKVAVGCQVSDKETVIRQAGVSVFPIPFARESLAPGTVLRAALATRRVLRQFRPDLVQLVALRAILVGWMGTVGGRRPPFINTVTGLGSLFSSAAPGWRLRWARWVVSLLSRLVFRQRHAYNVLQNRDDMEYFVGRGLSRPERSCLIRGSGVDPSAWTPVPEPPLDPAVVLYVGRLLRDKGVVDLVDASRLLRKRGVRHVLRLIGDADPCNPMSLTEDQLRSWEIEGAVERLGYRSDVLLQMSRAHLVALPSYREGLPRVLLEAGMAERAVVTCDTIGCRELVADGVNGSLVPPRDPERLANAIQRLIEDDNLRRQLASRHRQIVAEQFSSAVVNRQFCELYRRVLEENRLQKLASRG